MHEYLRPGNDIIFYLKQLISCTPPSQEFSWKTFEAEHLSKPLLAPEELDYPSMSCASTLLRQWLNFAVWRPARCRLTLEAPDTSPCSGPSSRLTPHIWNQETTHKNPIWLFFKKRTVVKLPPVQYCFISTIHAVLKKNPTKNNETMTNIIYTFTVQLYNISTRLNTLEAIYTVGFMSPRCTVFKQKYMTNLVHLHTLSSDWNAKRRKFRLQQ